MIGSTKGNGFSQHQLDGIALLTGITKLDLSTPPLPITAILYSRRNLLANLLVLGEGDTTDGDVIDGDATDGDVAHGDVMDGDAVDGDVTDGDMIDGDVDWDSFDLPGREKFLVVPGCRSYKSHCRSYTRPSDALRTCFGVSRRDSKFSVFPNSCGS